jgi:hypothetical protein
MKFRTLLAIATAAFFTPQFLGAAEPETAAPKIDTARETRTIEGWTVHISKSLLATNAAQTARMLDLLEGQLRGIVRVVPAPAVAELKKVPLWVSPEYPGTKPRAEFHPDAGWLRANGRDPAMVRGVEFTDVRNFERELVRMPVVVLHELAHAYHHRVLGFDNKEIKAAYDRAKASGKYDKVERWFGNGRPNTFERAYAMTTPQEYFAENTEAYFGRNDFFPFNREELKKHDPDIYAIIEKVWGVTPASTAPAQ